MKTKQSGVSEQANARIGGRYAGTKTLTIREAREGLSHPDQMFAGDDEVIVTRRGEPIARILPIAPQPRLRSLKAFLAGQPMQTVPSEVLIAEDREDRC
ncbi:MAG: type II toxin-antitoxin system prevent-host-death family antitoxin [Betaproteobacteria bacterium]|nr:type II toxin-antitoxin system prevent-host-death family antitoxin [Betaproteobacteria bacterium]